jgi:hypothetical protein
MKRKDLPHNIAGEMKKLNVVPWKDPENQNMLLADGDNVFILYSNEESLKTSQITLGITELKRSVKLNPDPKPSIMMNSGNSKIKTKDHARIYPKLNSESVILSKMQQGLVMELESGIKIFAYTARIDEVTTQCIVLESEEQQSEFSAYSRYMFEKMRKQASEAVKKQSQKCKETEAFMSELGHHKIIHFKNPRKARKLEAKKESIISCIRNCMGKADSIELTTIAFPPICTGNLLYVLIIFF